MSLFKRTDAAERLALKERIAGLEREKKQLEQRLDGEIGKAREVAAAQVKRAERFRGELADFAGEVQRLSRSADLKARAERLLRTHNR